jgi:hypothetical protein
MEGKKIVFTPEYTLTEREGLAPVTASKTIPDWYKKMPRHLDGRKNYFSIRGDTNFTIKACIPFIEALTVGYMVVTQTDMFVAQDDNGQPMFSWKKNGEFVSFHTIAQIPNFPVPDGFNPLPCKFTNNFLIQTPRNYSVLFTHPLNRTDLPFYTLSGVVETDNLEVSVNFPFFLKKDFEGIIEAGTPIAQIIPIKRETWKSKIKKTNEKITQKRYSDFYTKMMGHYKSLHWKKKDYQ